MICLKFGFTTIQGVEVDIINETQLTTHWILLEPGNGYVVVY